MLRITIGIVLVAVALGAMGTFTRAGENESLIVFSSDRTGPWRIWIAEPDGSDLKRISEARPDEHDVDPVFSPDGSRILFTSTRGGTTGLWTMAVDGSSSKRICHGDQGEWSPEAKRIVFRRDEALYVRELASERETQISPADWPHPSGPAWSPDGRRIAFACRWDAGNAIFVIPAVGGEPIRVYDKKGACEPHWSPDGKRLVYETETNLAAINPDGTKNRPLTWFGGVQRYGRYSRNGKSIVFCQGVTERGPWELYRIGASGGQPTRITEGGSDMNPDWR